MLTRLTVILIFEIVRTRDTSQGNTATSTAHTEHARTQERGAPAQTHRAPATHRSSKQLSAEAARRRARTRLRGSVRGTGYTGCVKRYKVEPLALRIGISRGPKKALKLECKLMPKKQRTYGLLPLRLGEDRAHGASFGKNLRATDYSHYV